MNMEVKKKLTLSLGKYNITTCPIVPLLTMKRNKQIWDFVRNTSHYYKTNTCKFGIYNVLI